MFADFRSLWQRRKAVNAGEAVYVRAGAQISRMTEQGTFGTSDAQLLNGEAELLSLTSQAASRVEDQYGRQIHGLADQRSALDQKIAGLRTELNQADEIKHLVAESPKVKGASQAMTIPTMTEKADELTEQIESETAQGETRHRHHSSKFKRFSAYFLLVIDVAALFVLMMKVENTSFSALTRTPESELTKVLTALCLSLLAATVLAVAGHKLGEAMYRRTHRSGDASGEPRPLVDRVVAIRAVAVVITIVAVVVGISLFMRVQHSAAPTDVADLAGVIGAAIAMCASIAPLIVAWVISTAASPEVAFRDMLSRRIAADSAHRATLVKAIGALELQRVAVDERAERTLADAERALQEAMLPATQLIVRLRTDFGHAGEVYAPVLLPETTERPAAIAWNSTERLRKAYRSAVVVPEPDEEPAGPHAIEKVA